MGFVKTPEEVAEIAGLLAETRYVVDQVAIGFETTEEFVRAVLPPVLSPIEKPAGMACVTRGQSSFCGEYDLAWVGLYAAYGDLVGVYTLSMIVAGDLGEVPITAGRDTWGEVKKQGKIGYSRDTDYVRGFAERHGVRLIEIEGHLTSADKGPRTVEYSTFDIKGLPAADGQGLQWNPLLVILDVVENDDTVRRGDGKLTLRGTPHDPLDEIPVVATGAALHAVGETIFTTRSATELDDPDAYAPYIFGRAYDDFSVFPRPQRYS
jgi:acetoacetate decarboxylase